MDTAVVATSGGERRWPTRRAVNRAGRWGWPVGAVVVYAAIAVALYWPLNPLDATHLPNAGVNDPAQMVWFLAWTPWAILHGHNPLFTSYLDYPHVVDLATNTSVPALGLLAAPVTLSLGPVAAFNLLLRASFVLSAGSMLAVLRRWTRSWPAAFAGGLLYGFSPYMTAQGQYNAHLDLLFVPIPPLLLLAVERLVTTPRPSLRLGLGLGLLAGVQELINAEVLSDCVLLAGSALAVLAVVHRRQLRAVVSRAAPAGGVALCCFLLVAGYPVWALVAGPGHITGPVYPTGVLEAIHSDLLGSIIPTSHEAIGPTALAHLADRFGAGNLAENGAYLGLPLILIATGLVLRWRRIPIVAVSGALAGLAYVLSLGPRLSVDGHRTPLVLPGAIFGVLPVLDSTVPARFTLFVGLFLAVVVAVGLDRLARRQPGPDRARGLSRLGPGLSAGLIAAVALVPLVPNAPWIDRSLPWGPGLVRTLGAVTRPGAVVLTYPYPVAAADSAMVWQAAAGMDFRLVGGYVSVAGGSAGTPYPPLRPPPSIQEILGAAELARASPYPAPAALSPGIEAAFRGFLARDDIGTVVYWPTGADPTLALRLFAAALGPPTETAGPMMVWTPGRRGAAG